MQKLQFDDIHTLVNALSFYSVVPWQLLNLTYTLRENPELSANQVFTPDELILLQASVKTTISTVREGVLALGRLWVLPLRGNNPFLA